MQKYKNSAIKTNRNKKLFWRGKMLKTQKGFTLIELVMIIVILGILAAVAIPTYVNLSGNAADSSARAALGAFRSTNAIMFSNRLVNSTAGTFTMGDIVAAAQVQGAVVTPAATTVQVAVGGNVYTFTLTPTPNVPTTMGSITASTATW